MATLFASLKILIAYVYSRTPKPYYSQLKFLDFLHKTEISALLVDVCLNSVAMVTLFGPLIFPIIYVNSLTPNTYLLFTQKFLSILYRSEICAILACFCLFGCHSNSLCSLKNSDSMFEFYNPETLSYT